MTVLIVSAVDPAGTPQGDRNRLSGAVRAVERLGGAVTVAVAGRHPGLVGASWPSRLGGAWRSPYMLRSGWHWVGPAVDGVIAFQLRMAPVALRVPAAWRVLDLTDSLDWYRRGLGWRPGAWMKQATLWGVGAEERRWAPRFDQVWVSAAPDQKWLAGRGVAAEVVENGVAERRRLPPGDPRHLLLVGNFGYLPNRQGLSHMLGLWPGLAAAGYRLTVVGEGSQGLFGPGLRGQGRVPDLLPYYQAAGIAVSPVRWGAGSPNKVLEAMGFARPVVADPGGVGGLSERQRAAVEMARTPREWLRALERLQDPACYRQKAWQGSQTVELWGEAARRSLGRLAVVWDDPP